jgi:glutamate dehydrogenase
MVQFKKMLPGKLPSESTELYKQKLKSLEEKGVRDDLAHEICSADFLYPATSLIEISQSTGEKLQVVADVYYSLGELLKLNWLGTMINQLPVSNYWQALARETYLDDLSWQQRALTCNVVNTKSLSGSGKTKVARWNEKHAATIARATNMLILLQAENNPDYSMFSVALRELLNLSHSTAHHC